MADSLKKSIILTLAYTNTDFTRRMTIEGVATSMTVREIEDRAIAVNESLAAGTDGGLADFFLSDDYDPEESPVIGKLKEISALRVETILETPIF